MMRLPKFSRWVTIPVLFILNFLAWLYIYDEYMMSWIIVYPLFILIATAFTISAELAFGKDRQIKYIGINICLVLLLLILAQKYFPMEKLEQNQRENYYGYIQADVNKLATRDKAVRINGFSIIAGNYRENAVSRVNEADTLEVYKDGKLIEKIAVTEAVNKIQGIVPQKKKADYYTILYQDVRYVGVKKKGGSISLVFNKGYVDFKYELEANGEGFIWDAEKYKLGSITLPEKEGLYGDETNKKIKNIILKGDREQIVTVKVTSKGEKGETTEKIKAMGYKITSEEPLTVEIPFYEIANLSHQEYIEHFEIK